MSGNYFTEVRPAEQTVIEWTKLTDEKVIELLTKACKRSRYEEWLTEFLVATLDYDPSLSSVIENTREKIYILNDVIWLRSCLKQVPILML